jgi:hypothetical protein
MIPAFSGVDGESAKGSEVEHVAPFEHPFPVFRRHPMRHRNLMTAAIVAAAVTAACSDTTAPNQLLSPESSGHSNRKTLDLTKECSAYGGKAGDYCTFISSNVKQIPLGARVYYLSAADLQHATLDSDVELRAQPGNVAYGHCSVSNIFATVAHTFLGHCSFSGGTGRFKRFHAEIVVTVGDDPSWADWDGTYSFGERD